MGPATRRCWPLGSACIPPPLTLSERLDQVQVATDSVMQQTSTVQGLSLVWASPSCWSQLPPFSAHRCSGRLPATVQIHLGTSWLWKQSGVLPLPGLLPWRASCSWKDGSITWRYTLTRHTQHSFAGDSDMASGWVSIVPETSGQPTPTFSQCPWTHSLSATT